MLGPPPMSLGTFGWRRATADGTAIATAAMIIPSMRVDGCIGNLSGLGNTGRRLSERAWELYDLNHTPFVLLKVIHDRVRVMRPSLSRAAKVR
jgi:hypothetical protein